ncbi:MAG: MFS transporter [Dehalococcoidales bacterium]|nr:MFS transporter [Dehalococcoidales bacterium]
MTDIKSNSTGNGNGLEQNGKPAWLRTFDALSIRDYRLFWLGSLTTFLANFILMTSQAWLAYELTHSALKLGLVSAAQGAPMVLIALFSGVIIDRVQKRTLILLTQSVTVVNTLTIGVLLSTHQVQYWHLLVSSCVAGVVAAFYIPARYSIVAELVPKEKIFNAFALNNSGQNTARVAGPAIAGLLIALAGTESAYYCSAGCFLIGTLTMTFLKPSSKLGLASAGSMIKNMIQGFSYLRLNSIIIILLIMEFALTLFGMPYQGLMPVIADILNVDSKAYGFMLSAVGIGAVIGSLAIASLGNFKRKGLLLLGAGILFGAILMLFANSAGLGSLLHLDQRTYYLAMALLLFIGACTTTYTATSTTIIQMQASDEYRGRVTSFYSIVLGLYPISITIAGALAEGVGATFTLTLWGGCLAAFMLIMALTNPRIRRLG